MNNKLVLFDFDGTLMDTEQAIIQSYRELFRHYRSEEEFTKEKQISVLGPSLYDMITSFFPDEDVEVLQKEYRAYQNEHLKELIQPMPNAIELLEWLKEKGYVVGIVTARRKDSLEHILELFNMKEYFDVLIGYYDVQKQKPDPEGILKAIGDTQYEEVYYVGDSVGDILAGKNAGVKTIAYLWMEERKEVLRNSDADYYIEDLLEVRDIV